MKRPNSKYEIGEGRSNLSYMHTGKGTKKILEIFFVFEVILALVTYPYRSGSHVTTLSALRTVALRHIYLISSHLVLM